MKFGIATFVTDEGISPLVLGPALEERGFDSVLLAEHSHIPTRRQPPYPSGGDCRASTTERWIRLSR